MSAKSVRRPSVSVVCPVFNAQDEILDFDKSIRKQKGVSLTEVIYVLTESSDHTEEVLKGAGIDFKKIKKKEFSHSLVREKAAMKARGQVIVFLTQDVVIHDDEFLAKLVAPIAAGEVQATYARQKTKYNNIEKYTRAHNYPSRSFTVSREDVKRLGLKTFFFSDAAGAVDASVFRRLKGYDGKKLPISEDMYFAYKLIMHGGKIRYVAGAVCYHSHDFKLSELYDRYKLTGEFMKQNPEIAKHGVNAAGGGMAKEILVSAARDKNARVLAGYVPNMAARYMGMTRGKVFGKKTRSGTSGRKSLSGIFAPMTATRREYAFMRKGER